MSGIAFSCASYTGGLTTSIFPEPQRSFVVDSITGPVGTSLTFTTNAGVVSGMDIHILVVVKLLHCKWN